MSTQKVLITGMLMIVLGLIVACGGGNGSGGGSESGGGSGTNGGAGPTMFSLADLEGTWDWVSGGDIGSMTFNGTGGIIAMTRAYCALIFGSSEVSAALDFSVQPSGTVGGAGEYHWAKSFIFVPNTRIYNLQLSADGKSMTGELVTSTNIIIETRSITFTKR